MASKRNKNAHIIPERYFFGLLIWVIFKTGLLIHDDRSAVGKLIWEKFDQGEGHMNAVIEVFTDFT